jgi:predicted DNA-binding transcriptional regulator YafY
LNYTYYLKPRISAFSHSYYQSQQPCDSARGCSKLCVTDSSLSIEHTEELKWWILGFGAKVAVLAPTSLREEIGAELDAAVLRYR